MLSRDYLKYFNFMHALNGYNNFCGTLIVHKLLSY